MPDARDQAADLSPSVHTHDRAGALRDELDGRFAVDEAGLARPLDDQPVGVRGFLSSIDTVPV